MGLDTVELVMEIEDAFGITIPDEDAEKIETIGQTAVYVVERLRLMSPVTEPRSSESRSYCATSRAFYQLRSELRSRFDIPRRLVMPISRIGELVRSRSQRTRWNEVASACRFRFERAGFMSPAFPPPGMTVRQLIYSRQERSSSNSSFYLPNGEVNTRSVWYRLRNIVSEQFGVIEPDLKWDTHYFNDLNAD